MNIKFFSLVFIAIILCAPLSSNAVCDQSAASQADKDLWSTHGCWKEYFLWQYRAYDMSEDDWGNRGWYDACNVKLEYPKHWNAAYLVSYGLLDSWRFSFHGTTDYEALAIGADNHFHDNLYHLCSDQTDCLGMFEWRFIGTNRLYTCCPVYDHAEPSSNPASRAGEFMHEGWHAWLSKYDWNNGSCWGHRCGPQGACTVGICDYFYFHGIATFAFGELYKTDGTAKTFHSPLQVQVEFLCDVAEYPQDWVPASVRLAAKSDANTRAVLGFINGPGYSCGDPRPW